MDPETEPPGEIAAEPSPPAAPPPAATPWWLRLWGRIHEHRVAQWVVAYAATAYAALHLTEMVADAFEWPHLVLRVVTVLLFAGAPIVATLAWYHGHRANHRISGPELAILAVLLMIAAALLSMLHWGGRAAESVHAASAAATGPANATDAAAMQASASPDAGTIAVLPFADLSAAQDQGYFADGMAEELIDVLARIPQLRVIGRTSAFQFKGRAGDLREIGSRLGAGYVVEGSVRKADAHIRVTAQLIDTHSGTHLWSESYDRELGDVLNLQDQIASSIARALQLTIHAADAPSPRPMHNSEAYTFYLRGRAALDGDIHSINQGVLDLQQALALEPGYTRAAEALALAYLSQMNSPEHPAARMWPLVDGAARRALQLDPRSALAHAILGLKYASFDFDWPAANAELQRALALDSRDAVALYNTSWLAFDLGLYDESLRLQDVSLVIDPLSPDAHQNGGIIYYLLGDFDAAERELRASANLGPHFEENHTYLGLVQLLRNRPQAALEEMLAEQGGMRDFGLALAFHSLGRHADSDAALARLIRDSGETAPCNIAIVYAYRGERQQAFQWLDRAVTLRDPSLGYKFRKDPMLVPLRTDPRYHALLERMHLGGGAPASGVSGAAGPAS